MRLKSILTLLTAAASVASVSTAASATTTVYVTGTGDEFGTINTSTGDFTFIADTPQTFEGLGFTPNGTLEGISDTGGLYSINVNTGATTLLNATGDNAIGGGDTNGAGTFFFTQNNTVTTGTLFTATPSTSATVGNTGFRNDGLVAFNNSTLYVDKFTPGGFNADDLYTVNPTTAAATLVAPFQTTYIIGGNPVVVDTQIFTGFFNSGTLFGFGDDSGFNTLSIYGINPTTANATFITDYLLNQGGAANNDVILGSAAVPEPGVVTTLVVGILGLLMLGARRRAQNRLI